MSERAQKYGARAVEWRGRVYDSTLERDVAMALHSMVGRGVVLAVREQVPYVLVDRQPGQRATKTRRAVPTLRKVLLIVDFVVALPHGEISIDAKGVQTAVFNLKRNLYQRHAEYPPLVVVRSVAEALRAVEEWAR